MEQKEQTFFSRKKKIKKKEKETSAKL